MLVPEFSRTALLAFFLISGIAHGAFNINFNFDASVDVSARGAAERAASSWEARLADDVGVNVDVSFASLGANTLGSTFSEQLSGDFDLIRNQMAVDESTEFSVNSSLSQLPTSANVQYSYRNSFNNQNIEYTTTGELTATKASLKALGFTGLDTLFGASDGSFQFSSDFDFDYDRSDGISSGFFDFESVVVHEIGHLLGFTSFVDEIDFLLDRGDTAISVTPHTSDLFRFDSNNLPQTDAEFTSLARDLSTEDDASLSDASIAYSMETGRLTGSGQQASHYKDNLGIGILDPTLAPGEIGEITGADLLALDLIGWEISAVPEPSNFALLAGSLALGFAFCSRNRG